MKFTIIMASLLSDYPGSATGKDKKLIRAVESVLKQTYMNFELIVIADGCALTEFVIKHNFDDKRINLIRVERKELWSNVPRNAGIDIAKGKYILYCDIDDKWGENHLRIIDDQMDNTENWLYYNDWRWSQNAKVIIPLSPPWNSNVNYNVGDKVSADGRNVIILCEGIHNDLFYKEDPDQPQTEPGFIERQIDVTLYGHCGTSNICHASRLGLKWEKPGYGHDFLFIKQLRKFEGKKINTPEYFVCHEI